MQLPPIFIPDIPDIDESTGFAVEPGLDMPDTVEVILGMAEVIDVSIAKGGGIVEPRHYGRTLFAIHLLHKQCVFHTRLGCP